MNPTVTGIAGAAIFVLALIHTFSTAVFQRLGLRYARHEGMFHLLGEVDVVFGS